MQALTSVCTIQYGFMPTAAFTTLGCKVNQYETQKILESFEEVGFDVVPFDSMADVYVVNTCSVTGSAEAKSRYTIRKARRTNPDSKIVVTGCAAQMEINEMEGEIHEVADVVVPNPKKLESLLFLQQQFPQFTVTSPKKTPVELIPSGRTRATLKVQDGCNAFCSYCSIPFTRPGMVSRHWKDVLLEAQELAKKGYLEAVLTGVLIGAYDAQSGSGGPDFEELVTILAKESGLSRLRISSIEMHQVTNPIVDLVKKGHLVPHFHIPLQAGDNAVLADMRRSYNQSDYLNLCRDLYREIPDLSLTTDVMVGFPTETHERFLSSVKVLEEVKFLKAHVFRFSPRPGTPADKWGDPISPQEKQERAMQLSQISERTASDVIRKYIGRTMQVLVEGKVGKDGLLEGLTPNWISVKFTGSPSMVRTLQFVRIDEERNGIAYGELASETKLGEIPIRQSS